MVELSLFGLGLLGLMAAWKFMLMPALRDNARDRLFDLREEVREEFLSKHSLNHPAYIELRTLINGHLRFVEEVSFLGFMLRLRLNAKLGPRPKSIENKHPRYNNELSEYMDLIRAKSYIIVLNYMIKTSFLAWIVVLIGGIVLFTQKAKGMLKDLGNGNGIHLSLARLAIISFVTMTSMFGLGSQASARTTLENCALHS
ncbi:hypothetical protein JOS77_28325 [Chromobacterium haemolyticum]|nr:hypothetical protein JOS77_28325 [Chromobacterium haemolyticum]